MTFYQIRNHKTGAVLFAGHYTSLRACAAQAVRDKISLTYADFSHAVLMQADLDGAQMHGSDFTGANLTGANLSEADLSGTCFTNATLHGACLCYTDMTGAQFTGTLFGGTDIAGTTLNRCLFSTESALLLDFSTSRELRDCIFHDEPGNRSCTFSDPPLVIRGGAEKITVFDRHIKIGQHSPKAIGPEMPPAHTVLCRETSCA